MRSVVGVGRKTFLLEGLRIVKCCEMIAKNTLPITRRIILCPFRSQYFTLTNHT